MIDETTLTAATAGKLFRLRADVRRRLAEAEVGQDVTVHVTFDRGQSSHQVHGHVVTVAEPYGNSLADVLVLFRPASDPSARGTAPWSAKTLAVSLSTVVRIERR